MFRFLSYFSKDIGIDLGTENILIYVVGTGIVINEPAIAAINNKTNKVIAIGHEAKKMVGKTPEHVEVITPIVSGVISDFEITQEILKHFLQKASGNKLFYQYRRAVVGIPSNLTEVERKSVEDVVFSSGISKVYLIENPLAIVLGSHLPLEEPTANMIVDFGHGTTEVAIISLNGIVKSKNLKIGGIKLNEDIIKYIRDEFRLIIGEPTAEDLKIKIGSALPLEERLEMNIQGRDLSTGLPKEVLVKDTQIRAAIIRSVKTIVETIREIIEQAPPELSGDILKRGIFLSGGGSLLRKINELISRELLVSTHIIDDPFTTVVRGTGVVIENFQKYKKIISEPTTPKEIKL